MIAANGWALEVCDVTCAYGGLRSVDSASFQVTAGEVVALVGPNGAGKTTLLNAISGLVETQSGRISVSGQDVTRLPAWKRARLGVARAFQMVRLFPDLQVIANVELGLAAKGYPGFFSSLLHLPRHKASESRARASALQALDAVHLRDLAGRNSAALSHGQSRRIELARTLIGEPVVALLDEPTSGLHAGAIQELVPIIRDLAKRGAAVILVEHNLRFVGEVADRVIVLHHGQIIATGTRDEVMNDPQVIEAYLGGVRHQPASAPTGEDHAPGP